MATDRAAGFSLRAASPQDVPAIVGLIRNLAEFEKLSHLVQITPAALHAELFGPNPAAECTVAQAPASDAVSGSADLVGFALYFTTFSTFLGRRGLWLEDLFVQPAWRGHGVGQALLRHGAQLARERGFGRYEWSVLDWNERAIRFYQGMGATVMPEWRICRVTGDALHTMSTPTSA